jgi:chromosomal replication initiation ATPase DnaA
MLFMTYNSDNLNSQFIKLTNCGKLEEFCADHPEKTVQPILDFLNDPGDSNVLLIRSDIGNGGTHLLSSAANLLLDRGEIIMCVSSEKVLLHVVNMQEEMRRYMAKCTFVCIDYFDYLLGHSETLKEVCSMLNQFLSDGGKVILQSSKRMEATDIMRYLNARSVVQVTTDFPTLETLKRIALQHVEPAVVEDLADTAFATTENSVRLFLGIMISEDAKRKLKEMEAR